MNKTLNFMSGWNCIDILERAKNIKMKCPGFTPGNFSLVARPLPLNMPQDMKLPLLQNRTKILPSVHDYQRSKSRFLWFFTGYIFGTKPHARSLGKTWCWWRWVWECLENLWWLISSQASNQLLFLSKIALI